MHSLYSIEFQLNSDYHLDHLSHVHAKALRTLGLTSTDGSAVEAVEIYDNRGRRWAVNVPVSRAEEYAQQLWKDDRVVRVTISGTEFPNPVEVNEELEAFKKKVYAVAKRVQAQKNWCAPGFRQAMEELGIEIPKKKVRIVLEVEIDPDGLDSHYDFSSVEGAKDFFVAGSKNYRGLAGCITASELIED